MADTLLNDLLRQTSRSFYLTLRVLPASIRPQISLAYLLARTTDTIADTEIVPLAKRLEALRHLRERILASSASPLTFAELARQQASPAERQLLEHVETALAELKRLSADDLQLVQAVLNTITSGQELDLRRFETASVAKIVSLQSDAELDDYTYRVAGCVGEFWTKMCRAHLFSKTALDDATLLQKGIRFGKGLQLINILRDLPRDLRTGRCYLPAQELQAVGLAPQELLKPENEPKLRPVYNDWLARAESHLAAGWEYTNALPRRSVRVRLACAWPILIGMKTAARLRSGNVLDPNQRIKISRDEVKRLMARSIATYPFRRLWENLFAEAAEK